MKNISKLYSIINFENMTFLPDIKPPVINCMPRQTFYTDRGTLNTSVTWVLPTATDNVDVNVTISQTSDHEQGIILSEGLHNVTYTATDSAGNSNNCTIELEVKGEYYISCLLVLILFVKSGNRISMHCNIIV
jgi:hypothetical protein